MELDKLVPFIQTYPTWFKVSIAAWIVFTSLLIVGLIMLRPGKPTAPKEETPPTATPPTATKVETPPSASLENISLEDYFSRLEAFGDRFLQRQEFIDLLAGRTVSWQGFVGSVNEYSGRLTVTLTTTQASGLPVALVGLPSEFRTQAFSLRRGDLVRVTGTLSLSTPYMPDLAARELAVLPPRESGR